MKRTSLGGVGAGVPVHTSFLTGGTVAGLSVLRGRAKMITAASSATIPTAPPIFAARDPRLLLGVASGAPASGGDTTSTVRLDSAGSVWLRATNFGAYCPFGITISIG